MPTPAPFSRDLSCWRWVSHGRSGFSAFISRGRDVSKRSLKTWFAVLGHRVVLESHVDGEPSYVRTEDLWTELLPLREADVSALRRAPRSSASRVGPWRRPDGRPHRIAGSRSSRWAAAWVGGTQFARGPVPFMADPKPGWRAPPGPSSDSGSRPTPALAVRGRARPQGQGIRVRATSHPFRSRSSRRWRRWRSSRWRTRIIRTVAWSAS